jgi:rhodanese-related sulfurtransferase
MKRFRSLLLVAMLTLVAIPVLADDGGIGETVADCAPKGATKVLPPGHFGLVANAADRFLSTPPGGHRTIYPETLMDGIDTPALADELGDFFLLDIRTPAEFAKDTVPGAVNILMTDLAKAENLAKLPTDKPILVICNTGHTASISNAVLGVLGYDAWTLRFGMMGWRASTKTKVWSPKYSQDIYGAGYPVQKAPL